MHLKHEICSGKIIPLNLDRPHVVEGLSGKKYEIFDTSSLAAFGSFFGKNRGGLNGEHIIGLLHNNPNVLLVLPGNLTAASQENSSNLKIYIENNIKQLDGIIASLYKVPEELLKKIIIIPTHQLIDGKKESIPLKIFEAHLYSKILSRIGKKNNLIVPYNSMALYSEESFPDGSFNPRVILREIGNVDLPAFGTHAATAGFNNSYLIKLFETLKLLEVLNKEIFKKNITIQDKEGLIDFLNTFGGKVKIYKVPFTLGQGRCVKYEFKENYSVSLDIEKIASFFKDQNVQKFMLFNEVGKKNFPKEITNQILLPFAEINLPKNKK